MPRVIFSEWVSRLFVSKHAALPRTTSQINIAAPGQQLPAAFDRVPLEAGALVQRWPFDREFYLATYKDVADAGIDPLHHFENFGKREGRYASEAALRFDRDLLANNADIFDVDFYRSQAARDSELQNASRLELIDDYLLRASTRGWQPNRELDAGFIAEYFHGAGFIRNPAVCLVITHGASWRQFADRLTCEGRLASIRAWQHLDVGSYAPLRPHLLEQEKLIEYAMLGEYVGRIISKEFDGTYYARKYPDVKMSGMCLLEHYVNHGIHEGRLGRRAQAKTELGDIAFDQNKPTVGMVIHEASLTGAPILGHNIARILSETYNIIVVILGDGNQLTTFRAVATHIIGPVGRGLSEYDAESISEALLNIDQPRYVLINSVESAVAAKALAMRFIPTVALVHEFSEYTRPLTKLQDLLFWATAVVYPAEIVKESAAAGNFMIQQRNCYTIAQGKSVVSQIESGVENLTDPDRYCAMIRGLNDAHVVMGVGSVQLRKGVDLFIQVASDFFRNDPTANVRFVWIGGGFNPATDVNYSVYLADQVKRSGLEGKVVFLDEISEIELAYAQCDVFLLTSRLDPFPNVAIDVALHSKPIVAFAGASGVAEWLSSLDVSTEVVAAYLDCKGAANRLRQLLNHAEKRNSVGKAIMNSARTKFDIISYCAELDKIAGEASQIVDQERLDTEFLTDRDEIFDLSFFVPPSAVMTPFEACRTFVRQWVAFGATDKSAPFLRKPSAGLDYRIFGSDSAPCNQLPFANPLGIGLSGGHAELLRHKGLELGAAPGLPSLNAALHIHAYFFDHLDDVLSRVAQNRATIDIFITTDSDEKATAIREIGRRRDQNLTVYVVPNRGRDIGPFFTGVWDKVRTYEVVGHVHLKKSSDIGNEQAVAAWRRFLYEHVLGGFYRAADAALLEFEKDPKLGLIYPDDPNLGSWDKNRAPGEALWRRMGFSTSLADYIDYPSGNMFWVRPAALRAVENLNLSWSDYPAEPLPYDGSMLHAFERLLPQIVTADGYRCLTIRASPLTR